MLSISKMKKIFNTFNIDNENIIIPKTDTNAWNIHKNYNWVYNRMLICKIQNIPYGMLDEKVNTYPIYIKSIINTLDIESTGQIIKNKNNLRKNIKPGYFWMEYFDYDDTFFEAIIVDGKLTWYTFHNANEPIKPSVILLNKCFNFIDNHMKNYDGFLRFIIKDTKIIDCFLTLSNKITY